MKKVIPGILILLMVFTAMSGCISKSPNSLKTAYNTPESSNSENNLSNVENETPGTELSTFVNNYMDTKSKTWDAMTKKLDEDKNYTFAMGSLGFAFADMIVIEVILFDSLSIKNGDSYKGKLMFTEIEAWKKINGNIIEFGYDYIYPEDKNQSKKGDHEAANGKYDKKDGTLTYTHYTERNGIIISKYIVEITRNSDTSYSSQLYNIDSAKDTGDGISLLTGYFIWFEGEDIISVIAEKDRSSFDFEYLSIYGKKDVKPEEMAKGLKINNKSSFISGIAAYEDLSK